jgi:hypothetical protein
MVLSSVPVGYNPNEPYDPLEYQNYVNARKYRNQFYRSQLIMRNMRKNIQNDSKCQKFVPALKVADNCNPAQEELMSNENLPDMSDVHVVMIDDPMIIILPDCIQTTTTCAPV